MFCTFQVFDRHFRDKTARFTVNDFTVFLPGFRITDGQGFFRPGDAYIGEAAFLLDALVILALKMRNTVLFKTDQVDIREFQPLGRMKGHQLHFF